MPKKLPRIKINLDLLKPQSQPQQIIIKLFKWFLSSGRFLIIVVEIVVLGAFLTRFKFDADIADTREAIEEQVPFIESLAADEKIIRQTQFQLASIKDIKQNTPDFTRSLQKIASQTPTGVTIKTLETEKVSGKIILNVTATASDNRQLASFIAGLQQDGGFSDVNLADVSLEGDSIIFTVTASTVGFGQDKKL